MRASLTGSSSPNAGKNDPAGNEPCRSYGSLSELSGSGNVTWPTLGGHGASPFLKTLSGHPAFTYMLCGSN